MSTAAFFGVSAGKQFLRSSFLPAELADKLIAFPDQGLLPVTTTSVWQYNVLAKKSSNFRTEKGATRKIRRQCLKAFREDIDGFSISPTSEASNRSSAVVDKNHSFELEVERSLEVLILLQKSMLEKQWYLSFDHTKFREFSSLTGSERTEVVRSGNLSARQRRLEGRRKSSTQNFVKQELTSQIGVKSKQGMSVRVESLRNSITDHVKGMLNQKLLTHEEVVRLSTKIQIGINLEKHKSRLKVKLGYEPSNAQWAASMNMSTTELNRKLIDSFIAAEKLTMCNIRLVISIARKYENMGVEMGDLIQEGLIGLRRGIKKFDSSKGFKLSTYVYWWIRQGVTKALAERSRIVRVPAHLHERMGSIRKATLTLEANGVTPSLQNIARTLNISERKVQNAQKGKKKILSFDKGFCGLENDASETLHSSIADSSVENQPWFTVERDALKEDVNKLISSTLTKREQVIIRLYHGLDTGSRTYEDISKSIGLSRERVRQIGLVSMEKLRHATRRVKLEPIYMKPS